MAGAWSRARRILEMMRREGWIDTRRYGRRRRDSGAALAGGNELPARVIGAMCSIKPPRRRQTWRAAERQDGSGGSTHGRFETASRGTGSVRAGVLGAGKGRDVSQGALVALGPGRRDTGDGRRAWIIKASAFNRVTQARRQPGSAFKAFVFGAAMEGGDKPTDTRVDAPISQGQLDAGELWRPLPWDLFRWPRPWRFRSTALP